MADLSRVPHPVDQSRPMVDPNWPLRRLAWRQRVSSRQSSSGRQRYMGLETERYCASSDSQRWGSCPSQRDLDGVSNWYTYVTSLRQQCMQPVRQRRGEYTISQNREPISGRRSQNSLEGHLQGGSVSCECQEPSSPPQR